MYSIKDGFHIQMFWTSCHWGNKRKVTKKLEDEKKNYMKNVFT